MKVTSGFVVCIKTNTKDTVQNAEQICGIVSIIIGVVNVQNIGHVLHHQFVHNHDHHGSQ